MTFARFQMLALLAALALLLAGSALGSPHYLCHMTGRVTADCCCASTDAVDDAGCIPKAAPGDCCELLTPPTGAQANRDASPSDAIQPAALAAILPEPIYVFPGALAPTFVAKRSRGPPLVGPPLFIAHCALLT